MSNSVISFSGSEVRIINVDGEYWFCASDIAKILEYRDAPNMVRGLSDEDITTHIVSSNTKGNPNLTFISEAGLYQVMLNAKTERVKPFKHWITHEVLPSLRKTGRYECAQQVYGQISPVPEAAERSAAYLSMLGMSTGILQADALERDLAYYNSTGSHFLCKEMLTEARESVEKLVHDRSVNSTTKQAAYCAVADFGDAQPITAIAKSYGDKRITSKVVNDWLIEGGFQTRVRRGKYRKTSLSRDIAVSSEIASGPHKGSDYITGWIRNDQLERFLNGKIRENGLLG